jgi:hypothetical protein
MRYAFPVYGKKRQVDMVIMPAAHARPDSKLSPFTVGFKLDKAG